MFDQSSDGSASSWAAAAIQRSTYMSELGQDVGDDALRAALVCVFCKVEFEKVALARSGNREIKLLPCFHSVCGNCLEHILESGDEVECTVCGESVGEDPYHSYLCNFFVHQKIDHGIVEDKETIACDECVEACPAISYCDECTLKLCAACGAHHSRARTTSLHKLRHIAEQSEHAMHRTSYCPEHKRVLEFYCTDCCQLCCHECIVSSHDNHDYKLPGTVLVEGERSKLKDQVADLYAAAAALQRRRDQISEKLWNLEEGQKAAQANLVRVVLQVKAAIEGRRQWLHNEIQEMKSKRKQELEHLRVALTAEMVSSWRTIDFVEKTLHSGNWLEILWLKSHLTWEQVGERITPVQGFNPFGGIIWRRTVANEALESVKGMAEVSLSNARNREIIDYANNCEPRSLHAHSMDERNSSQKLDTAGIIKITADLLEDRSEDAKKTISIDSCLRKPISLDHSLFGSLGTPMPAEPPNGVQLCMHQSAHLSPKQQIPRNIWQSHTSSRHRGVHEVSNDFLVRHGIGLLKTVIGKKGAGQDCFMSPCGLCVDSTRIYIADTLNHRIQILCKQSGQPRGELKGKMKPDFEELRDPSGLCLIAEGHLGIVEYGCDRMLLVKLASNSSEVEQAVALDTPFFGPFGCAYSRGRVYVADGCNHRCVSVSIDSDSQQPSVLFEFGSRGHGPGEFEVPCCIGALSDGYLAVSDKDNQRIQVFNHDGNLSHFVPHNWSPLDRGQQVGVPPGKLNGPMGVCLDEQDRLYVCDCANNRVQIFTRNGRWLWSSDSFACQMRFQSPTAIAIDDMGAVYVASDHCVQVFQVPIDHETD